MVWADSPHRLIAIPIPSESAIRRALLELASDGKVLRLGGAVESLADRFDLPFAERNEETSSGNKRSYDRVSFASLDVRQNDLLEAVKRAHFRITPRGYTLLKKHPGPYPDSVLRTYGRR